MTTITLWLLLSVGTGSGQVATTLVERFATEADCKAVIAALDDSSASRKLRCIRAVVVKP